MNTSRPSEQRIDIDLDGVLQEPVDQDWGSGGRLGGREHVAFQGVLAVGNLHRPPPEHVARAHHDRVADARGYLLRFRDRPAGPVRRLAKPQLVEERPEPLEILGLVDCVGRRADDRDPGPLERRRELERGLAAELHDDAHELPPALLRPRDGDHVLDRQRLEVEPVGGVVVGRDGFRVAVDHDRLEAGLPEAEARVDTAIVELDALTDAVRSAPEDDDLPRVARLGFVLGRIEAVALVAGVEVGRAGRELGRAGVDTLEHRPDARALARGTEGFLAGRGACTSARPRARVRAALSVPAAGEPAEEAVGESQLLEAEQGARVARDPGSPNLLFRLHDHAKLLEEPGVVAGDGVDLPVGEAVSHRLRDDEDAIGRGTREAGDDSVFGGIVERDRVETGESGLHRAKRLLQRLGEGAPDRHGFAHRLHRGGEPGLGTGKLLERDTRDLGHHVVDRGLEARRGHPGKVVPDLVQGVADGELRRHLRDGKSGRLRGERGRARDTRIELDHHHPPARRVDRELHVGPARVDADLADRGERGVAHDLVLLVGQRRRHGDRVARMHPHRVDVLDRAHDDAVVGAIAHDLHLVLLPAEYRFLDQHLRHRARVQAAPHDVFELLAVVGDASSRTPESEAWPDDGGKADRVERVAGFRHAVDGHAMGALEADPLHRVAELLAILRLVDGVEGRPDELGAEAVQHPGGRERAGRC